VMLAMRGGLPSPIEWFRCGSEQGSKQFTTKDTEDLLPPSVSFVVNSLVVNLPRPPCSSFSPPTC
jgi:hypothetical protein